MSPFGLDNGYRSKCHYAPIRIGFKKLKSGTRVKIWVCTKCGKRDVDIIAREQINLQTDDEEPQMLDE